MSDSNNSNAAFLKDIFDAFKYAVESRNGKLSLETYLDIIGEYVDRQIIDGQKRGSEFTGGECSVQLAEDGDVILFKVLMYFKKVDGGMIEMNASRPMPLNKFVTETRTRIGDKTLRFPIEKPVLEV